MGEPRFPQKKLNVNFAHKDLIFYILNHMATTTPKPIPTFKCVLLGDGESGKSTFVRRHLTGEFTPNYIPTLGVEVHPLTFATSHGPVCFNVWDTAGQDKFGGLRTGYYIQADCAILMFDLTKKSTYLNLNKWYQDILNVCPNIPIVLVGNKFDQTNHKIQQVEITFHREHQLQYYNVSAKSNYEFEKPFIWLTRHLTKNPNLVFVEEAPIQPKLVTLPNPTTLSNPPPAPLTQAEMDAQLDTIPLFIPAWDDDLMLYRVDLPDSCPLDYGMPDAEFKYKIGKLEKDIGVVYMPKLLEYLKSHGLSQQEIEVFKKIRDTAMQKNP